MNRNSYNHSIILIRLNIRVLIRRTRYSLSLSLVRETDRYDYWFSYFTFEIVSTGVSIRAVKTINYKLTSLHRSTIIKYVRMNFSIISHRFVFTRFSVIITSNQDYVLIIYIVIIPRRWFSFFSVKEILFFARFFPPFIIRNKIIL